MAPAVAPLPPAAPTVDPPAPADFVLSMHRRDGRLDLAVAPGAAPAGAHLQPLGDFDPTVGGAVPGILRTFHAISVTAGGVAGRAERLRLAAEAGHALWFALPAAFRTFYWDVLHPWRAAHGAPPSVLILSAEHGFPWELARPVPRGAEDGDPPALGQSCALGRWRPHLPLPRSVAVSRLTVAAPTTGYPWANRVARGWANREIDALRRFLGGVAGGEVRVLDPADRSALLGALGAADAQALHVNAHGAFDPRGPSHSRIALLDGDFDPLQVPVGAFLALDPPPFVFLNSCEAGRSGAPAADAETGPADGPGGWADAFTDAGCAAFVGPVWPVGAEQAGWVARFFYEGLAAGGTIGETMRSIRARFAPPLTRGGFDARATPLAYAVHGHPNARVRPASPT